MRWSIGSGPLKLLRLIEAFVKRYGPEGCFSSQDWLARRFRVTVRTIQRWVRTLVSKGWVAVERRGPLTALYKVLPRVDKPVQDFAQASFFGPEDVASNVASDVGSSASGPYTEPYGYTGGGKTRTASPSQMRSQNPQPAAVPVLSAGRGGDSPTEQAFQNYIGICLAAGKPINHVDVARSRVLWRELTPQGRESATRHMEDTCRNTDDPKYIPLPQNHLRSEAWTRSCPERKLPTKFDRMVALLKFELSGGFSNL